MKQIHEKMDMLREVELKIIDDKIHNKKLQKDFSDSDDEDYWEHGDMDIELAHNIVSFKTGQMIHGVVIAEHKQQFKSKTLNLTLLGLEIFNDD